MAGRVTLRPWCPPVDGVREVLHAHFPAGGHEYPMHAHETWTLLLVDHGLVRYRLEGREHLAGPGDVTLLPPRVPHDGAPATAAGFRKRVVYLDADALPPALVAAAVERPHRTSEPLRRDVSELCDSLTHTGPSRSRADSAQGLDDVLAGVTAAWTDMAVPPRAPVPGPRDATPRAERLRELLDAGLGAGLTLQEAARALGGSPSALGHAFTRRFGMSPHRYLVSRRLDRARDLLLAGRPPAEVAAVTGFHDQAHLTRHFKRLLGLPPGAWAASAQAVGSRL